jgi:hypothetical protein
MIALSDNQLQTAMKAAQPLDPSKRAVLLERVAGHLRVTGLRRVRDRDVEAAHQERAGWAGALSGLAGNPPRDCRPARSRPQRAVENLVRKTPRGALAPCRQRGGAVAALDASAKTLFQALTEGAVHPQELLRRVGATLILCDGLAGEFCPMNFFDRWPIRHGRPLAL